MKRPETCNDESIDKWATWGVLALNLVTRDAEVSAEAKKKVDEHFPALSAVASEEDVKEVWFGWGGIS